MELNREQIIKALECCRYGGRCAECPCFEIPNCQAIVNENAISIIKKLTEENKAWQQRLIAEKEQADKAYYELACEVEDLRAIAEQYQKQFEDCYEENERLKAEKKEGKWKQAYNSFPKYVCTNCNHLFNNKSFKYCPNCGARMDGERKTV